MWMEKIEIFFVVDTEMNYFQMIQIQKIPFIISMINIERIDY